MININLEAARDFAILANNYIKASASEDVLRHLFSAYLPQMFPDNTWWIQEHSTGAEAHVNYVDAEGLMRTGFVDSLVGKTVIEYEKNLTIRAIYEEGYYQVKEYCAALLNQEVHCNDIIGVLSDTVRWYAFRANIERVPTSGLDYGPEDITLEQIDAVNLQDTSDDNLKLFGHFINRYLGRKGSRRLVSTVLTMDMGFESVFYYQHIEEFREVVNDAFSSREHYGNMIAFLWQSFVNYLENNGEQTFNRNAYTNELYMITLAKLLCANILNEAPVPCHEFTLKSILNGQWFKEKGFVNIVEYDYFGWLNETPFINDIVSIAIRMQNDLSAYDYSNVESEDLFGPLIAQLADKDRRLLLGQEFTPQWLSEKIVSHAIEILPEDEYPNFVDMCCGSGVFVVETIKQTIKRYHISPENCNDDTLHILINCIVGFDIDPLAVLLSKLNWAMAIRAFVPYVNTDLLIPIYHADSLFTVAPITNIIDDDYQVKAIRMAFDGEEVILPGFLITPANRELFDSLIQTCYETARVRVKYSAGDFPRTQAVMLVRRLISNAGVDLNEEQCDELCSSCHNLIFTLEKLQREGRNGIWPFLLGNSYRPGFVRKQFNAILSNPPWMAMSKLADNPYKTVLVSWAERYGIKPTGSSHLHVELATVFLLNSVDKYLKDNAIYGIIMPDTLLNGYHHELFRKQQFFQAEWPVDLKVNEIWDIPVDTFKNKAIVLFGQKVRSVNSDIILGRRIRKGMPDELCEYRLLRQGRRTAWSPNPSAQTITEGVLESIPFLQGADIMPRTLVFHKAVSQPNKKWSIQPIQRQNDALSYLVSNAKMHVDFSLNAINIDAQFIYDCYMSNHILPFFVCSPAKALLPMKKVNGRWQVVDEQELIRYGTSSFAAFTRIFRKAGETARQYFDRINYRNKLNPQIFETISNEKQLVMAGAGGGYTCAAYIPIDQIFKDKTIIDQTLYWYIAQSEDEALYITGLLNSQALDTIIADFQPEGALGRRHVHKLPYMVTPPFDAEDLAHLLVVEKTRALKNRLDEILPSSDIIKYCSPARSSLSVRRRKFRLLIQQLPESIDYEDACRGVYNV